MIHEYNSVELRKIISGKNVFKKCPSCDEEGHVYWDENEGLPEPAPLPEWGENYMSGDCEECDGLGYFLWVESIGPDLSF